LVAVWEEMFAALVVFQKVQGHCNVLAYGDERDGGRALLEMDRRRATGHALL
jgi:hypothetical protein